MCRYISISNLCLLISIQSLTNAKKCDTPTVVDDETVTECLQPMLNYANELQSHSSSGPMQFPVQGAQIFERLCLLYRNFKECVSKVQCDGLSIEAVDASYGYMCSGDGYQLFKKYVDCFAKVESQNNYLKCKHTATSAIDNVQSIKAGDIRVYFDHLCTIMDEYLRCSHPLITDSCGDEAWTLVAKVTEDSLRVTMPNCDLHRALI